MILMAFELNANDGAQAYECAQIIYLSIIIRIYRSSINADAFVSIKRFTHVKCIF